MTGTRIRWDDGSQSHEYATSVGYVGPSRWNWYAFGIYAETDGPVAGLRTHFLTSALPGQARLRRFGHPDDLKAEAERWLSEFVAALGAVFPEDEISDGEDEEPLEVRFAAGRRVRYAHPGYGYPGDMSHAAGHLIIGAVYTIVRADIGQSSTGLLLQGIPNELFNSVLFEPVDDQEPGHVCDDSCAMHGLEG